MEQQQITADTVLRSSEKTNDESGTIFQAETVRNGLYISAGHVIPEFLRKQLKHPDAIEGAVWSELDGLIDAAAAANRGTPAIKVIQDMRTQMTRISQTAQILQQKYAELSNALEAAHIETHRAKEKAVELLEQRNQLEAGISAVAEGCGVNADSIGAMPLRLYENAVAVARRIRLARAEAEAGISDVVDAEFDDAKPY